MGPHDVDHMMVTNNDVHPALKGTGHPALEPGLEKESKGDMGLSSRRPTTHRKVEGILQRSPQSHQHAFQRGGRAVGL